MILFSTAITRLILIPKSYRNFWNKYKYSTSKCECSAVENQEKNVPIRRIFSGIQPTGAIHLGNYLGAIAEWVKLQNENHDMILEVADLHSITLPQDPKLLSRNILQITATLLACGIDPNKVILFQQSMVHTHAELCWLLGCICTMARLAHLPAFKEKSASIKDVPLGLYVYPVLQAADILAYKGTHVPVGEDQSQHIQLAQELARMFNSRFGNTFPLPCSIKTDSKYSRLRSLREPSKKMSKSDPDPKSRICLTDTPDEIINKFKKAVTDFTSEVSYDPESRPGVSNLISIHSFVTNKSVEDICEEAKGLNTGQYKRIVADAVVSHIDPIRKEIKTLLADEKYLLDILRCGAEKAKVISEETVSEVKYKLGLDFKIDERKIRSIPTHI